MNIAIGCDHAGYELKEEIIKQLKELGHTTNDFGAFGLDSVDYPDHGHQVCNDIEAGNADCGILICGSANGMTMTANKHEGIRCALCWVPEVAALARQHNNANSIALPALFISKELAKDIVRAYLEAEFEGGRHQRRVDKIND
ncbi:MAG: ribose 5-phosphate isomerase B [Salibacteraceae bacterium]